MVFVGNAGIVLTNTPEFSFVLTLPGITNDLFAIAGNSNEVIVAGDEEPTRSAALALLGYFAATAAAPALGAFPVPLVGLGSSATFSQVARSEDYSALRDVLTEEVAVVAIIVASGSQPVPFLYFQF